MLPFTPRLSAALSNAYALAMSEGRQVISDIHMLYGIVSLGSGVAANVLMRNGVDASLFCDASPEPPSQSDGSWPYSRNALAALSASIREAITVSHELVGVEHLLLGLLSSPSNGMTEFSRQHRINVEKIVSIVRSEI